MLGNVTTSPAYPGIATVGRTSTTASNATAPLSAPATMSMSGATIGSTSVSTTACAYMSGSASRIACSRKTDDPPSLASSTWRGTLPGLNPGTRSSPARRRAVWRTAWSTSSSSISTERRTLFPSTGEAVARIGVTTVLVRSARPTRSPPAEPATRSGDSDPGIARRRRVEPWRSDRRCCARTGVSNWCCGYPRHRDGPGDNPTQKIRLPWEVIPGCPRHPGSTAT